MQSWRLLMKLFKESSMIISPWLSGRLVLALNQTWTAIKLLPIEPSRSWEDPSEINLCILMMMSTGLNPATIAIPLPCILLQFWRPIEFFFLTLDSFMKLWTEKLRSSTILSKLGEPTPKMQLPSHWAKSSRAMPTRWKWPLRESKPKSHKFQNLLKEEQLLALVWTVISDSLKPLQKKYRGKQDTSLQLPLTNLRAWPLKTPWWNSMELWTPLLLG